MVGLQAQSMVFCYSLTGVRSSSVADFLMASAICRTKWSGLARLAVAVDLSRLRSLTGVLRAIALVATVTSAPPQGRRPFGVL
jgi:hypothetical protein